MNDEAIKNTIKRLEGLEKRIRLLEDTPQPPSKVIDQFWDKSEGIFSGLAEHLLKIALFPEHRDQDGWKDSVYSQLLQILRKTSHRSLRKRTPKSYVKTLFKSSQEITSRINDELSDALNTVLEKMAPDIHLKDDSIEDFNSLLDLGFNIEQYRDPVYGWNYRIVQNGAEIIADTNERDRA